MNRPPTTDVLIIGGGPVGLFAAYNLARQGVSVRIFDNLAEPAPGGRADGIHPRTMEILASVDVVSELVQLGFHGTYALTYVNGVQSSEIRMAPESDTEFDYLLLVGQQYIERVLTEALAKHGVVVERPTTIERLEVVEDKYNKYPVTAELRNLKTKKHELVQAKYAIGCDGAHSWVRKWLRIAFEGETSTIAWGVIDAFIESNISDRQIRIFYNETGGTLYIPREQGLTRIYVQMSKEVDTRRERENLKLDDILEQAAKNFQPFTFKASEVTWWTSWTAGGRAVLVFGSYIPRRRCLVGHHRLNTGLNDAFNIAWKLSLTIKDAAQPSLLSTYQTERRAIAQQVIDIDRKASHYLSQKMPSGSSPGFGSTPHKEFLYVIRKNQGFSNGLGIEYDPNLIVIRDTVDGITSDAFEANVAVLAGQRAPDGFMTRHRDGKMVRLIREMSLDGRFYILVLAGNPALTWADLEAFDTHLTTGDSFWRRFGVHGSTAPPRLFNFLLIGTDIDNSQVNMLKYLRITESEHVYVEDGNVHKKYGVDVAKGAVIVVRPDGWIGACIDLRNFPALEEYFQRFLVEK
ncbi:FAD binding domain-containing protein [Jimgerdemannia flammicorona]|uniref:FAD binding domain-containing protein n=1 Tax=Jimgerdemannia flammicorona TaxID=994334 RepID=A0A433Q7A5_9FUNG|nr:FAD binding domain-containing protein [Jimgerdemannia flammicorona]